MLQHLLNNSNILLELDDVSKKFSYSLANARKYGLRDVLRSMCGLTHRDGYLRKGEFWAVRNVSFHLKRGETLGIIGLNGSGKSTILKMINGLYLPDKGEIRIKGEVGALIELSAGFHSMLTGRENIYVKGALLGKSKEEMDDLYQQIVDFAELGTFIDSAIKTYSSGMHVRLGFAVAAHINPDILLLDEVLAVGDFPFRQKCMDKINQIRQNTSIIFVSHSMESVSLFCDRVIVLDKGIIVYEGQAVDAIKYYLSEVDTRDRNKKNKNQPQKGVKDITPFFGELFLNEEKISKIKHYWADKDLNRIEFVETGSEVNIIVRFKLKTKPKNNLVIGIPIWDKNGNYITGLATDIDQVPLIGDEKNRYQIILNFPELTFNPNEYISLIVIIDGLEFYYRGLNDVIPVQNHRRHFGFITASHKWQIG